MASGFPSGRETVGFRYGPGSAVRIPFPARSEAAVSGGGGGGSVLKRSLTEMERLQQQQQLQVQLQHALFLRSVKQRTQLASAVSPVGFASASSSPLTSSSSSLLTPSSSSSSAALATPTSFGHSRRQEVSFSAGGVPPAVRMVPAGRAAGPAANPTMKNRLEELERRLLLDDDDEESALTNSDWSDAIEHLISTPAPTQPPAMATQTTIPHSPSPTNSASSSSTVSSVASCSPTSSVAAPSSRQMLLDAAAAISEGNVDMAAASLAVLKRAANSRGDAEQRLTAMLVTALLSRLNTQTSSSQAPSSAVAASVHPVSELCSAEHFVATQMLYDMSPCFKLGLFAANYAILEAANDQSKIHILDFEVGHGGHYAVLLRALADRHRPATAARPPPEVKITAFADPTSPFTNTNNNGGATTGTLRAVGDRIENLAENAGLKLRFNVVSRRVAELDSATLGCEPGEALAVNLPFVLSRVADESVSPANPRDELLRRVRALRPRVVVLLEQEINTNTAAFTGRFAEACGHYGALLESLDATAARDSSERARVEAALFRKAINSVAREGADRVERCEVFGKWRARMSMAGFQQVALGPAVTDQVKARLAAPARPNPGFTAKEDMAGPGLGIGFGWMGRVVTVASAWR